MPKKEYVLMYLLFCLIGGGLEWFYGAFWAMVGTTVWTYPGSPFHHTSWAVLPGWGFGGLVCVSIYRALMWKKARFLLSAIPPLVLSVLWILIYTQFIG